MLVRVLARRVHLLGVEGGDPEVLGDEPRPAQTVRSRLVAVADVVTRHQFVGDRVAVGVADLRVLDPPVPAGERVDGPLRRRLAGQQRRCRPPRVPGGVVRPGGIRLAVDLVDGVGEPVDHHVQPDVEEVLVVGPVDVRGDQRAVARPLAVGDCAVRDHAGELDLVLDAAVLIEVPVEAVLVVAHRGDGRDHQPPGTPDLDEAAPEIEVLPEDPGVLLVQADRVLDRHRLAPVVRDHAVEVADLAETVAAQLQGVGPDAEPELAHVEDVLAVLGGPGVAVGDEHLRQGGPVDDRAQDVSVLVADGVQHQALARCEADPEAPLLPPHLVAVDIEAGAIRLDDLELAEVRARAPRHVGHVVRVGEGLDRVVGGPRRNGDRAVVGDLEDLHLVQVEERDQVLDRARVAVVGGIPPHPGEGPDGPPATGLVVRAVVARGPGIHHRQLEVRDPPRAYGLLPVGVGLDRALACHQLVDGDRGLDVGPFAPRAKLAGGQRDHRLDGRPAGPLPQHHHDLTVDRAARLVAQHDLLGRLFERHAVHPHARSQPVLRVQDRRRRLDLLGGQRRQRVLHSSRYP